MAYDSSARAALIRVIRGGNAEFTMRPNIGGDDRRTERQPDQYRGCTPPVAGSSCTGENIDPPQGRERPPVLLNLG
jgi:hypothetical protein